MSETDRGYVPNRSAFAWLLLYLVACAVPPTLAIALVGGPAGFFSDVIVGYAIMLWFALAMWIVANGFADCLGQGLGTWGYVNGIVVALVIGTVITLTIRLYPGPAAQWLWFFGQAVILMMVLVFSATVTHGAVRRIRSGNIRAAEEDLKQRQERERGASVAREEAERNLSELRRA